MKRYEVWLRVLAFVIVGYFLLAAWGKIDWCSGWSRHYAARAADLRREAANPALSEEEKTEYLVAADCHDIISEKYRRVAWQPWRPYPKAPLVTKGEIATLIAKHSAE